MILRFSDEFLPYTNQLPQLVIECETVGEGLNKAFESYPQLYVHLMDGKAEVARKSMFSLNGEYIYEVDDCKIEVASGDVLVLEMNVPAGESTGFRYVLGVVLVVVGALVQIYGGPVAWVGPYIWKTGAMMLFSTAMMDLFGPTLPQPDAGGGLGNSSAYTFNGIRNTTAAGTPLQIVYGKFRVGGQYLNVYTTSSSTSEVDGSGNPIARSYDWLHAQIGLCEGEIESISNVLINKLPANYYNAVEFLNTETGEILPDNFRLGTATQPPMPDFRMTSNTTTLNRKVICPDVEPVVITTDVTTSDHAVYGYRLGDKIDYGSFILVESADGSTFYQEVPRGTPGQLQLRWEDRDPSADGAADQPYQVNIGGYVYTRYYQGGGQANFAATTFTRVVTSREVNGCTITITFPGGIYAVDPSVGYVNNTVKLAVLYRKLETTGPWNIVKANRSTGMTHEITGKQRAELIKTYDIGDIGTGGKYALAYAKYEIAVVRLTPDHSGWFNLIDDFYVKEITEYESGKLAYPYTAMLGARIRATDQLSGSLPAITSLVEGMKIALPLGIDGHPITTDLGPDYWSGNLTWDEGTETGVKYWSDNPAWCLYDLLTNKRYGLAEYYKIDPNKLGLMRANFFMAGTYCDQQIQFRDENGDLHWRKRFRLNIVLDQSKSASEWVAAIAGVMRATCFYTEGIFWVEIDRPKYVSQIFNMTSIKEYAQAGTSYRSIPNCYEVQYPSDSMDYEMDSFRVESKELQTGPYIEERKKALQLAGVTDFEHAKALAKYAMVAGKYLTKIVTFKTGTQGIRCTIADIIGIQHDVPQTGWGGVLNSVTMNSPYAEVTLSSPFEYLEGMGAIEIILEQKGEKPVTLTATALTGAAVDTLTVDCRYVPSPVEPETIYTPTAGAGYILTLVTNAVSTFKVASIKRDADELCEITAVQYDEQIYTLADDTSDLGVFVQPDYSLLTNPTRVSVRSLVASMKIERDSAGFLKTAIEIFYTIPTSSFWTGAVVHWGLAGTFNYQSLPVDTTGHVLIPDITVAGRYQVVVTSVYKNGQQSISDALADDFYRPYAFVDVTPFVQNDSFLAGVSGLEVVGSLDGNYYGQDCKIQWRSPVVVDQFLNTNVTTTATGNNTSSWLAYYQVEIRNVDGTLRRTARVISEYYEYSREMNHEDGQGRATRTYDVTVIAVDRLGRNSAPKTLRVTNPPPAAIGPFSVFTGIKTFTVSFNPSAELDVTGYLLHASLDADFVPTASNLVNQGPETRITCHVTTGGTWYFRIAAYDTFEDIASTDFSGLNYSALGSANVPTLDPLDLVAPAVPVGLTLATQVDTTGQADMSSITATWTQNTEDDFSGYLLQIRRESDVDFVEIQVASGTLSYVFQGLIPDTEYSVRIAGYDKWANNSAFSEWVTIVSATSTVVPDAPYSVDISAGFGTISVIVSSIQANTWKEYEIQASETGSFVNVAYGTKTASQITSISTAPGTYYVRARSISRSGVPSTWTLSTPTFVVIDATATALLTELKGKLTESALYQTLTERINLIDAPGTGLVQQMVSVNNNLSSIQTTINSLTVSPFDSAESYTVGNLVTFEGNTYKAILVNPAPSQSPADSAYWVLSTNSTSLAALVYEETQLRIAENEAIAAAILGTQSTLNGNTTAIAMTMETVNGLGGQWTVKIDNGNRVVGVGLSSGDPGAANSEFIVLADKFQVVIPGLNDAEPMIPFTAGLVNNVPAVVMDKAYIADASIDTAHIGTLDIGSAKVTGTLSANRIAANSISSGKFEVGVVTLVNETWQGANPLSNWQNMSAAGIITIVPNAGGVVGSSILRMGDNAYNDQAWLIGTQNIPFDPQRLYRIRARVRRTAGSGLLYVGWVGVAADGVTFVSTTGLPNYTGQHYHVAAAAAPDATWTEYEGYTRGFSATNGTSIVGTLKVPGKMHPNVRYIRPLIVGNYQGQSGIMEVDSFIAEWMPVVLAPEYFENGTFSKTLSVGDDRVLLDGVNRRITIKDNALVDRVILGNLGSSYGLDIRNAAGQSLLTTSGDLEGTRIQNLYVTGNQIVGGSLTIGGATFNYQAGTGFGADQGSILNSEIVVGGRNFLSGTSEEKTVTRDYSFLISAPLPPGRYIYSFWLKANQNTTASVRLHDDTGASRVRWWSATINVSTAYAYYEVPFDLVTTDGVSTDNIRMRVYAAASTDILTGKFSKLEAGTIATSWTPALDEIGNHTYYGTEDRSFAVNGDLWYNSATASLTRYDQGTNTWVPIADSTTGILNLNQALTVNAQLEITGSGVIKAGKTGPYNGAGTGYWFDNIGGVPKFCMGSASSYIKWDSTTGMLDIRGKLNADDITAGILKSRTIRTSTEDIGKRVVISATTNDLNAYDETNDIIAHIGEYNCGAEGNARVYAKGMLAIYGESTDAYGVGVTAIAHGTGGKGLHAVSHYGAGGRFANLLGGGPDIQLAGNGISTKVITARYPYSLPTAASLNLTSWDMVAWGTYQRADETIYPVFLSWRATGGYQGWHWRYLDQSHCEGCPAA